MSNAAAFPCRFGRFELRPAARQLLADGEPVALGARAYDVLLALIERRDQVVGHDELLELAWPGLVVEENNLRQQVSALRKLLGVDAVVTVSGRGYRFACPVQSIGETPLGAAPRTPAVVSDPGATIAVLPFSLMIDDATIGMLADGLAEDVTTLLARVPGLRVISRSSSFVFRGPEGRAPEIARQLGVHYLVEGSVRAGAGRVRVSTQLVDAARGHVLWSGTFESTRDELIELQDRIARGVLSELEPQVNRAEIARVERQRPDNIDAWGWYRQGIGQLGDTGLNEASLHAALERFERAMQAAPNFGLPHAHHAMLTAVGIAISLLSDDAELRAQAIERADRALELDPGSPEVLGYAGCALVDTGRRNDGLRVLRHAVAVDPSNAQARVALGAGLGVDGDFDGAVRWMRDGMSISPRDRRLGFWGWVLADYLRRAGRRTEAIDEVRLSRQRDPRLFLAPLLEALMLAEDGYDAEASQALITARRLRPALDLRHVAKVHGRDASARLQHVWHLAP